MEHSALKRFNDHLGKRPYCSDDGTATRIRALDQAKRYSYLSLNRRRVAYLAFDIDREGAAFTHEHVGLPPPTFAIVNPENAHAHLLYELASPVLTSDAARIAPIRYMADIEVRMCSHMIADPAFAGLMVKNPNHQRWLTIANDARYDLGVLLEYLPDRLPRRPQQIAGWGRNTSLFDALRAWAYPRVANAKEAGFERWLEGCIHQAEALNSFSTPLPASEIRSISKSVARWTWNKYTGSAQRERVIAAAQQLGSAHNLPAEAVLQLWPGAVAKAAGCHRDTVHELRKETQC